MDRSLSKSEVSRGPQLAEGFGELAAEPLVLFGEVPVTFAGGLEPVQKGRVEGLARVSSCRRRAATAR
jgi:hypothetical protein